MTIHDSPRTENYWGPYPLDPAIPGEYPLDPDSLCGHV